MTHYHCAPNYCPTAANIVQSAVNGSLVSFAYGRYDQFGTYQGVPLMIWTGGHVVRSRSPAAAGS